MDRGEEQTPARHGIRPGPSTPLVGELDKPLTYNVLKKQWQRFVEKVGFEGVRPYALRPYVRHHQPRSRREHQDHLRHPRTRVAVLYARPLCGLHPLDKQGAIQQVRLTARIAAAGRIVLELLYSAAFCLGCVIIQALR